MAEDNKEKLVELKGVSFGYPGRSRVLDSLDFDFHRGDRIGLLGPNGCGKTTLLHVIVGLVTPQDGDIYVFGRHREKEHDFLDVRRRIGLLFQDSNDQLFSPTVAEDVAFGPLNLGKSTHEAMDIASRTLDMVGLAGFEDRITYKLSGGEKRLVALATILAMEPEVLLLDEPAAGLDEPTTERIIDILDNSGLSLIAISHQKSFLDRTAGTLLTLKNGRIEKLE